MSPHSGRARRAAARVALATSLGIVALAGAAGCGPTTGEAEAPLPAPAAGPPAGRAAGDAAGIDLTALDAVPDDDRVWAEAIRRAKRDPAALARLHDAARALAARYPARWQPVWTAAESEFWRARAAGEPHERDRRLCAEALALAEAADDPVGIARSANRLGWIAFEAADAGRALELFQRALEASRQAGRDDIEAYVHNALARLQALGGDLPAAVDSLRVASELLERIGSPDAPWVAHNRASLLRDLGRVAESLELLERLHADAERRGDVRLADHARQALGQVHLSLDELETAREWFLRIEGDDEQLAASVALGLGRIALRRGELDQALAWLDRAAGQQAHRQAAMLARVYRAEARLRGGRPAEARTELEPLVAGLEDGSYPEASHRALAVLAKAHLAGDGGASAALPLLERAVAIIDEQGGGLDPSGEGLTYLRSRAEPFADLAATLAATGRDPREVYDVVERAHARSLRRLLPGARSVEVTSADEVRRSLGPGELVLDYLVGRDRSVVVALSAEGMAAHELAGLDEAGPALARWRQALSRPLVSAEARLDPLADLRRDLDAGMELYRWLLAPVAGPLERARRVWIVPDQGLALLPFHAIPRPEADGAPAAPDGWPTPAGERWEFGVLPMAGAVPHDAGPRTPLLLAGDPLPDPGGDFGALAQAGEELDRVRRVWEPGASATLLDGAELTLEGLRASGLESYRTIHLATHAVASSLDPRRCAVILSRGERWSLQQVAEARLGPALVVLSACRTGQGEIVPGEGVVGLSWAFLRAGAQGVAASLWSVEDASTASLMQAFHARLHEGRDPVAALALAREAVRRQRPHPVWWAPFVVVMRPAGDTMAAGAGGVP